MKKEKRWDKKGNMRYRLFDKWTGADAHETEIRESWVLRRWCRIKMISFACIGGEVSLSYEWLKQDERLIRMIFLWLWSVVVVRSQREQKSAHA